MVWHGVQYFQLKVSKSQMSAFIPKGTPLAPEIAELDYSTFVDFLLGQHGIVHPPPPETLESLKLSQRANPYGLRSNMEIVRGRDPLPGKPSVLEKVRYKGIPEDMVLANRPFLQFKPAQSPQPGLDVHGKEILTDERVEGFKDLVLPETMSINDQGDVISRVGGQAKIHGNEVRFTPLYRVDDPTEPVFQKFEFHCDVWIEGDLAGSMEWRIHGALRVDGHLSAPNLEVHGLLEVKQGIQTNLEGVIRVYGDATMGYLQMSRLAVEGSLTVYRGILQSEVRCGKMVRVNGVPGAIQGSKVFCLGAIQASRVGNDGGVATRLIMPFVDQTRPIKLGTVSSGTHITFKRKSWKTSSSSTFSATSEG